MGVWAVRPRGGLRVPPRRDGGLGWLGLARSSEEGAGWSPCARGARGVWRWEGRNAGKVGVQKARGIGVAIVGQATVPRSQGFLVQIDRDRFAGPGRRGSVDVRRR